MSNTNKPLYPKILSRKSSGPHFNEARMDVVESRFYMLMYLKGSRYPLKRLSKKLGYNEAQDGSHTLIGMMARYIITYNCFLHEEKEDSARVELLEFYESNVGGGKLLIRLFTPIDERPIEEQKKEKKVLYSLHNYLEGNSFLTNQIEAIYKKLNEDAKIGIDRKKRGISIEQEKKDFIFKPFPSMALWHEHIGNLLLRYPERGKVYAYKEEYEKMFFPKKNDLMVENPEHFEKFLSSIKIKLTEIDYNQFFKPEFFKFLSYSNKILSIQLKNKRQFELLERYFPKEIKYGLVETYGNKNQIHFKFLETEKNDGRSN